MQLQELSSEVYLPRQLLVEQWVVEQVGRLVDYLRQLMVQQVRWQEQQDRAYTPLQQLWEHQGL